MKRIIFIILILLFIPTILTWAVNYPGVVINDQLLNLERIRVINNSYYVEIEELMSKCNFDFWFIDEDKSVTIFSEASTYTIYVNDRILYDGVIYTSPGLVIIDEGDVYFSIRKFSEILNYKVYWLDDYRVAKLSTSKEYDYNYINEDIGLSLISKREEREAYELEIIRQQRLKDIEDEKPVFVLPPLNSEAKPPSQSNKVAYLTFDDGPSSTTLKVLDILDNYKVKATFFVIGANAQRNPEIIKSIYTKGHTIGNHTYSHDNNKLYKGPYYFWEELYTTNKIIKDIINIQTKLLRVPYGSSNFTSTYLEYMRNRDGYKVYGWNIDSKDSLPGGKTVEEIYLNTINGIKRNSTPLILFHDSNGKSEMLRALPHIIEYLWEQGYNIQPLDYNTELKGVIR